MQKSSGTGGGVMDPVPEHVAEVCNLDRETVCIKGVLIQKRDLKIVFYMAQALPEHCHTSKLILPKICLKNYYFVYRYFISICNLT